MSTNPYQTVSGQSSKPVGRQAALQQVRGPAISLIVVSIFCLLFLTVTIAFDFYLLFSGMASELAPPPAGISKETQIGIRITWSFLIFAVSVIVLLAGVKMNQLKSYSFAKTGAVLAVIPCLGPCCIFGIPFGIWALIVLHQPGVQKSFE